MDEQAGSPPGRFREYNGTFVQKILHWTRPYGCQRFVVWHSTYELE